MQVTKFRSKIKPHVKLLVGNKKFDVKEVIKFRFNDGDFYIKCFLSDGYVFADDLNENIFLLVRQVKTPFKQPFPEKLNFQGKDFKFLYSAHAVAEEIYGEEIFKKGESEKFWDYTADDGNYLSLGVNDSTNERLDFYGEIIKPDNVNIE